MTRPNSNLRILIAIVIFACGFSCHSSAEETKGAKSDVSSAKKDAQSEKPKAKKKKYSKPSRKEIKKKLTRLQYKVTQQDGTERAFKNAYWNNKKEGVYRCVSGG